MNKILRHTGALFLFIIAVVLTSCAHDVIRKTDSEWVPAGSKECRALTRLLDSAPVAGTYMAAISPPKLDTLTIVEWGHATSSHMSRESIHGFVVDSLSRVVCRQVYAAFDLGAKGGRIAAFGNCFVAPEKSTESEVTFVSIMVPGGLGGGRYILIDVDLVPESVKSRTKPPLKAKTNSVPKPIKTVGGTP